jgi:LDH2 family malate/lactate/ureidoglycolate dehydrogenase
MGTEETAIRVMPGPLRQMTTDIFCKLDLPEQDAKRIAECLVQVDLRGVFSHGTRQIKRYMGEYQMCTLNPNPEIKLIRESPVSALFDGDGGLGYLAATRVAGAVIQKAMDSGIAIAGSRHHGHVGSEGIYARMALEHDLVTWSVAGGAGWKPPEDPNASIWKSMAAPPMCFGIPSEDGPPFVLDMNVNMFKDPDLMTEAMERFPGTVVKSLGMRFVSTLLGGMLAGSVPAAERDGKFSNAARGYLIVAFRPDTLGDLQEFKKEVTRVVGESLKLQPMAGQQTTELAGTLEWRREQDWSREGIPLGSAHRETVEEAAKSVGVGVPW